MRRPLAALMLLGALAAAPARAAFIDLDASELRGNAVAFEALGPGLLAIDPDFVNAGPIDLTIVLEPEDGGSLAWNALVDNLTGEAWGAFAIEAMGAAIGIGTAVANGGLVASIDASAGGATIRFAPPESAGIDLGAVFGTGANWSFAPVGATFRVQLAPIPVPEPATLAALALGVTALAARRSGIVRARHAGATSVPGRLPLR